MASIESANSNLKKSFIENNLKDKPFATELGFVTESVNEIVKLAEQNGATILEEPKEKLWGQIVAYLIDIDGFLLEICTPMNQ